MMQRLQGYCTVIAIHVMSCTVRIEFFYYLSALSIMQIAINYRDGHGFGDRGFAVAGLVCGTVCRKICGRSLATDSLGDT